MSYASASGWLGIVMLIAFLTGIGGLIADAAFGVSPLHMPWWCWTAILVVIALIAPFQAFHAINVKVSQLTSETLKIDPEPQFEAATDCWRIAVTNTSKKTLKVSVRVKGLLSRMSYDLNFPLPLQATHQPSTFKVGVGPSIQELFDLCRIDGDRLIFLGPPPMQSMRAEWDCLIVSAYSDDRAFDECRFVIARHVRGFWELRRFNERDY